MAMSREAVVGGLFLAGAAWFALRRSPAQVAAYGGQAGFDLDVFGRVADWGASLLGADFWEPRGDVIIGEPILHGMDGETVLEGSNGGDNLSGWNPPVAAAPYMAAITLAERVHGIPHMLLARLLYQESKFRPEVISGAKSSAAGAKGIAQIVPRWHPGVDPLDPAAAIDYAAQYLRALYDRFGTWSLALAAYNWGPTALASNGFAAAPKETRNYVAQITADVPVV
ncbi:hypothetical protein ABIE65_005039 [Constrictibacter sp. MBR-5]|jgi:hypothetical protein|uniref:lytic transglycosylase domain-containing protein n=1 Tax=Constrictibacter sp. MBR-5 TaxID=3156467 RepID=UPI003398F556